MNVFPKGSRVLSDFPNQDACILLDPLLDELPIYRGPDGTLSAASWMVANMTKLLKPPDFPSAVDLVDAEWLWDVECALY